MMTTTRRLSARLLDIFRFYRRNWLFWLILMAALLLVLFFLSSSFIHQNTIPTVSQINGAVAGVNFITGIAVTVIGLFVISYDLRNGILKTYFTRPCSPGLWFGSHLLGLTVLLALIFLVHYVVVSFLGRMWGYSLQVPLTYRFIYDYFRYLSLVGMAGLGNLIVHPVLAGILTLLLSSTFVYGIANFLRNFISDLPGLLESVYFWTFYLLFIVLPGYLPYQFAAGDYRDYYESPLHDLLNDFLVTQGLKLTIILVIGNSLVVVMLCFLLGVKVLERRNIT